MEENKNMKNNVKIALLIDAENISIKYIDVIFSELKKYGDITYQRIYGDFSGNKLAEWSKKALEYSLVPIHQPNYTSGKNAADIMLVIDAMDILYQKNVDMFCIVSSDSDFTRLVNRIKEDAMYVVGMGGSKASRTFVNACNEYKFLDKIIDEEINIKEETIESIIDDITEETVTEKNILIDEADTFKINIDTNIKEQDADKTAITPIEKIKGAINSIVVEAENKGEFANMGSAKNNLQRLFPDFDERNYGYSRFRTFIEEETKFEIKIDGYTAYIIRKNTNKDNTEAKVLKYIKEKAENCIELGLLGNEIHKKFPQFNYKNLGYSRFSKFIEKVDGVKIDTTTKNRKYVKLK